MELVERLREVAEQAGLTMTQLGLGFVSSHPAVTSTIIGPKTMSQLEELLGAADIAIDTDALDAIDQIVPPGSDAHGIEHFVNNPAVRAESRRR
jgi:aryl-alcohol dehydrogenase (NADP+)